MSDWEILLLIVVPIAGVYGFVMVKLDKAIRERDSAVRAAFRRLEVLGGFGGPRSPYPEEVCAFDGCVAKSVGLYVRDAPDVPPGQNVPLCDEHRGSYAGPWKILNGCK